MVFPNLYSYIISLRLYYIHKFMIGTLLIYYVKLLNLIARIEYVILGERIVDLDLWSLVITLDEITDSTEYIFYSIFHIKFFCI